MDVNETKLTNYLGCAVHPALITEDSGIQTGFIGPVGLKNAQILFDRSLENAFNLCCGANQEDYHYVGFNISRITVRQNITILPRRLKGAYVLSAAGML